MMPQQSAGGPHLVILAPDALSGRHIELSKDYLVVGREPTCDVWLDDPHVSRTHAALQRRGNAVSVEDFGSSGGTFVNGARTAMTELRPGDIVTFATVQARFHVVLTAADETRAMPTPVRPVRPGPGRTESEPGASAQADPAQARSARYSIAGQHGDVISNVGRDQYYAHVDQVVQQRDTLMREIAATRTRARWLAWAGFLLFVAGFVPFAAAVLNSLRQIGNDIQTSSFAFTGPFGPDIAGIPSGVLGAAVAMIGMLLLVIGIVLHVVAISRRRQVEREYPVPVLQPDSRPSGRKG
jgi:pSer/pThr/pTyr-binding forkhead associated (FHA) protein